MLWITIITTIIIAVISLLILSTHIIISRITEIRTMHRTTVQDPRQEDMAPHRVLFMEVRATVMAVAFRAKCKMFSRHLQKPILKTEKGRFKGL